MCVCVCVCVFVCMDMCVRLFTADENRKYANNISDYKKKYFVAENLLYPTVLMRFLYLL